MLDVVRHQGRHADAEVHVGAGQQLCRGTVFQFSYDLPGLGGKYRAVHTGDIPLLSGNQTEPGTAMNLYGAAIRGEDPKATWPLFTAHEATVLWLGDVVEPDRICSPTSSRSSPTTA